MNKIQKQGLALDLAKLVAPIFNERFPDDDSVSKCLLAVEKRNNHTAAAAAAAASFLLKMKALLKKWIQEQ